SLAHQALGALQGNRLDADAAVFGEANLGDTHFLSEELDDLFCFRTAGFPLDPRINIFRVFAEDDHVHIAGFLHRTGHALEPAYRALAYVEIQFLTQGNVQRANAAANGGGQWALDGNHEVAHGVQGFLGQPGILIINGGGFFAGVNFHPCNLALAAIGFLDGCIHYLDHDRTDINTNAIALDEGDDRVVRYSKRHVGINGDFVTVSRHLDLLVSHAGLRVIVEPGCNCPSVPNWAGQKNLSIVRRRYKGTLQARRTNGILRRRDITVIRAC